MRPGPGLTGNTEPRSYRIHHVLGQGGFGAVYHAEMIGAGGFAKPVAIKILAGDLKDVGEVAQRMRDEARMLGLLRHRAIVNVDGLVMLEGRWAIIMEYVDGVDLGTLAAKARLPIGPTLEIVEEVASALNVAYNNPGPNGTPMRVLHRDIKPQNIQLTAQGEVKVLDFGIARAEFDTREAKTQSLMFGSAGYMAPERLDMIERHEGDVYSLGVVLYELLTGDAFGKAQASPRRHEEQVANARARLINDGIPDDIVAMVVHLTRYEPEDRPSAQDVARTARVLHRKIEGPSLVDWSPAAVAAARSTQEKRADALTGRVIVETTGSHSEPPATTWEAVPKSSDRSPEPALAVPPAVAPRAPTPVEAPSRMRAAPVVAAAGVGATLLGGGAVVVGLLVVTGVAAVWYASSSPGVAERTVVPVEALDDAGGVAVVGDVEPALDDVPRGLPSNVPSRSDAALAVVPPVEAGEAAVVGCAEAHDLEPIAATGSLGAAQRRCLTERVTDPGLKPTDQMAAGRTLLVNDLAVCRAGGGCDDYESLQRLYFDRVDRSDPDLMLAFVVHLWGEAGHGVEQDREVVVWADRALENKHAWQSGLYITNVSRLMEIRAKAAYRVWQDRTESNDPAMGKARGVARTAAVDWLDFNVQLGRDAWEATALCESISGTVDACRRGFSEAATVTTITLTSIPMGLALFVDGEARGKTPQNLELAPGAHEVRIVGATGQEGTRSFAVGGGEPIRHLWKSESGEWTAGF